MSLVSAHDPIGSSPTRYASTIAAQQGSPGDPTQIGVGREDAAERGKRVAILVRILEDAHEAIDRDREAARAYIARASALLRDDIEDDQGPVTLIRGGLAPWQIIRVKAHIEAHLESTIRMRDLAAIARLSASHFCHSFMRSLGIAPFAYVIERRLARAQELMLRTEDSLSQIALACGLCDQSHLTRLFRRHVGTSPNVWRRRHKGELDAQHAALAAQPPKPGPVALATERGVSIQMYSCARP